VKSSVSVCILTNISKEKEKKRLYSEQNNFQLCIIDFIEIIQKLV